MTIQNITDLTLNATEYCFLVGKQSHGSSSFKVRHPKLIPLTSGGIPKAINTTFNSSIFANDKKCKPSVSKSLSTQNYITMKRSINCSLSHLKDGQGNIANGTRLKCACYNENPKDMTIIDG